MTRARPARLFAACFAAALLGGGCGPAPDAAPPAPSEGAPSVSGRPAPTPAQPGLRKKRYTIVMIAKSSTNPVFLSALKGAEAAARELSEKHGIEVAVVWRTPPTEDGQAQAQRIQQAVNERASAILISCSDAGKVTGAINDAVDAGVPVMTFDSDAPDSRRFAFYGVDDFRTGKTVMEELAAALKGRGRIGILAGNQNAPNLRRRVEGVLAEAARYPDIQVAGTFYHVETPQDAAAQVLRTMNAYPDLAGWAMIGGWALFTQALLTDLDPAKVTVVSVDALPAELPYVAKGIAPVLLAQPTYQWGHVGVSTIIAKLHLQKEPASAILPMELVRVTRDNLGTWARQLRDWGFADVPAEYLALEK
jgi:ribose transport system substrate-binding protein